MNQGKGQFSQKRGSIFYNPIGNGLAKDDPK